MGLLHLVALPEQEGPGISPPPSLDFLGAGERCGHGRGNQPLGGPGRAAGVGGAGGARPVAGVPGGAGPRPLVRLISLHSTVSRGRRRRRREGRGRGRRNPTLDNFCSAAAASVVAASACCTCGAPGKGGSPSPSGFSQSSTMACLSTPDSTGKPPCKTPVTGGHGGGLG